MVAPLAATLQAENSTRDSVGSSVSPREITAAAGAGANVVPEMTSELKLFPGEILDNGYGLIAFSFWID